MRKFSLELLKMLEEATSEIEQYCNDNAWVNEIKTYINQWSVKLFSEWKEIGAFEIDDQLSKIKAWTESVKTSIDKTIISKNKILRIDSTPLEDFLVPRLDAIYAEICECLMAAINKEVTSFISIMEGILEELKLQPTTIEDFANYTKKVFKYKENMSSYEGRINSIKQLTDVARINYRALNQEEEQLDNQAQEYWKSFIFVMQESVDFVNTQSPNILEQLDELYNVCLFCILFVMF